MVTLTIAQICDEKQLAGKHPIHATRSELLQRGCTIEAIREACKSGAVKWGRTINDYYYVNNNERK